MAGVDVGEGARGRRSIAADINMIPFIDLLFVTLAFLLITAVWTQHEHLSTRADVPGEPGPTGTKPQRVLEVAVRDTSFELTWRLEGTVVSTESVPRSAIDRDGQPSYPALSRALASSYLTHADVSGDCRGNCQTQAVLRTDDNLPFSEVIAVLDALAAPKHAITLPDGTHGEIPAFMATFAAR